MFQHCMCIRIYRCVCIAEGHFLHGDTQQTLNIVPLLGQHWTSVAEGIPTLAQHWFAILCLCEASVCTAALWLVSRLETTTDHDHGHEMAKAGLTTYLFCTFFENKTVCLYTNTGVMWDTFVNKWHINSILFLVAMVSHNNLNIRGHSYFEQ